MMMMDPKFGKPVSFGRANQDQLPDTPTRVAHHRRAHSDTFFRFPDLDDILVDGVLADLNLELPPQPPTKKSDGANPKPLSHLRSLSVDADFFDGLVLDGPPPPEAETRPRHKQNNSMDGYSSTTSSEVDSFGKKAMAADRLAELALIDPKRAKRILANRQSAARSKERKTHYTGDLERKVQTLQSEATKLSAQITLMQRDTGSLTVENKELKLKLQAMEQQAHLRDALNEALKNELQWMKITVSQTHNANGSNLRSSPFLPTNYFGNHQQPQSHNNARPSP